MQEKDIRDSMVDEEISIGNEIDDELDIRGNICPNTFIKTKRKIKEMKKGEILKVKVDYPLCLENIPRDMENLGQEVLGVKEVSDSEWEIYIKKLGVLSLKGD